MNPPTRPPGKDTAPLSKSNTLISKPRAGEAPPQPATGTLKPVAPPASKSAAPSKRRVPAGKATRESSPQPDSRIEAHLSAQPEARTADSSSANAQPDSRTATASPAAARPAAQAAPDVHSTAPATGAGHRPVSAQERYEAIARAAYLRSEARGFTPGYELEDWLAAEREYEAGT